MQPEVAPSPEPGDPERLRSMLGRYVVVAEAGQGGMGQVLRAYDPKLQREVALKRVHRRLDDKAKSRLVGEARSMAKLSHRNVVQVYDVEEQADGSLILVMEYVPGGTLLDWLEQQAREPDQIIEAFVAAGRGLLAAHAAGVLHRDFKPSNVLVGDEDAGARGIKVTDFGLATSVSAPVRAGRSLDDEGDVTQTGVVSGTPRYMAPEQHFDDSVTAAADQYAWCVSLWEALCGSAPFLADDLPTAKLEGPPAWTGPRVSPRLVEALQRGLHPDPSQRWPSLSALLDTFAPAPTRRLAGPVALGVIAVLGLGGVLMADEAAAVAPCSGAAEQLDEVWDADRRQQVVLAIDNSGVSYRETAKERVTANLDEYAADWTAMYADACEATSVRHEQSEHEMDLRMSCLHRARIGLDATVAQLVDADAGVLERTGALLGQLPVVARCGDVEALASDVGEPRPEERETVELIREHVARGKAARVAGRFEQSEQALDEARAQLDSIRYVPARWAVAVERHYLLDDTGRYREAEQAAREAFELAAAHRRAGNMGSMAQRLVFTVGFRLQEVDRAAAYLPIARGFAVNDPSLDAYVNTAWAAVLEASGRNAEALEHYRRGLAILESLDTDPIQLANTRNDMCGALFAMGRYAEAEAIFRDILAQQIELLGPEHPRLAVLYTNIAGSLFGQEKIAEGVPLARRALELTEQHMGSDNPQAATIRANLANALHELGKFDEAIEEHRKALDVFSQTVGAEHPMTAQIQTNLGRALIEEGKFEEAEVVLLRARQSLRAQFPENHPLVARTNDMLAQLMLSRGDTVGAHMLARAAYAAMDREDVAPRKRAGAALTLAKTLWENREGPEDAARARALAATARDVFVEDGPAPDPDAVEQIDAWLDAHPVD